MNCSEIVVIEDNEADVHLIELALKEYGVCYSLTRFDRRMEAVQAFRAGKSILRPDLILLDLNTPGTDGFDVLGELKKSEMLSGVPIAVLTSSAARSDKQQALAHGARYIEKACQLDQFLNSVGQAVKELLTHAAKLSVG